MATHRFDLGADEPSAVEVDRTTRGLDVTVADQRWRVDVVANDARGGTLRMESVAGGAADAVGTGDTGEDSTNVAPVPRRIERVHAVDEGDAVSVWWNGRTWRLPVVQRQARRAGGAAAGPGGDVIVAPMPGTVLDVKVAPGDAVDAETVVVVMESMKMEMGLPAPRAGVVATVTVEAGQMVDMNAPLVTLEPAEDGSGG
ncbi:MAG: acetyl-CoA carboxylase biotin carboxyl carrier protein subunit [Phycisphaerales bacterium]